MRKQLASLTDIKMLIEAAVEKSKCEIWWEQDEEDWLTLVFSLSAEGKRVTVSYRLVELEAHINELEPRVFKELMDAWNDAPQIVLA